MGALLVAVGVLGAIYWIPGAYLMVTGHSVPGWLLWPYKNPKSKRWMQMFGAALFVFGAGCEILAISVNAGSSVDVLGGSILAVIAITAVVFMFGGIFFARSPKP